MRTFHWTILALLILGPYSKARQDPQATERVPVAATGTNGSFYNAFPRWLSPTVIDAVISTQPNNNPIVTPVLYDQSISVDSINNAHVVGIRVLPGVQGSALCYYTNRFETRQTNGFSPYLPLEVSDTSNAPVEPDISVAPDDVLTVVWVRYN